MAAIMYTDMVGYTALGQRNESLSLALVDEQRKLIRPILHRHNGREVKTMGDAFLVEFPNASDAVRCAYDIQRAAREFNISMPEDKRVHLRVGLHLGEVVESEGDISGDAVNVASRIEPLSDDGGVCITGQVYDHVQNKFELPMKSIGTPPLKNVSVPIEVYKVVMPWEEREVVSSVQLDRKRIAVLPFANISPDPSDEYFADGMTEELISTMSRISGLKVIARTSVMGYKGGQKKISEVAKELEVGTILEGSVRKAGDRLRITVQLIDSRTSDHLWAESYDRDLKDVFAIQSEISQRVAESLEVRLLVKERKALEKQPTKNTEAYSLYLEAFKHGTMSEGSAKRSIECLESAVHLDPSFALAYSLLAQTYSVSGNNGWMVPADAEVKAESALSRALAIDETLPEVHLAVAPMRYGRYDWPGAMSHLRRAIELSPNLPLAHSWLGLLLTQTGHPEPGLNEAKRGMELDPLHRRNWIVSYALYCSRRYDEALEQARKLAFILPDLVSPHSMIGYCHLGKLHYEEAISEFSKAAELAKGDNTGWALGDLAIAYALSGRLDEAKKLVNHYEELSKKQYIPPDVIGGILLFMGKRDEGFELLDKAVEQRKSVWAYDLYANPIFDRVRSDPRFKQLLKKANFE